MQTLYSLDSLLPVLPRSIRGFVDPVGRLRPGATNRSSGRVTGLGEQQIAFAGQDRIAETHVREASLNSEAE